MADGPVYWHQGLFLQPQHFQILEGRTAAALAPVMANIAPFFWGVASGELNEASLAAGRLEIKQIRLVFPSSPETIAFPGNAVCAGRQVPLESIPVDGAMTAYVGLRSAKPGEVNVTVAENAARMAVAPTRMAVPVEPEMVPNANGDGPPAKVRRMSYVLSLVFENELDQAGDLDLVPVGRLIRKGDAVVLDHGFVPPLLTLSASPLLSSMFKAIRDRVLGKARQLESFKNLSARGPASGDFTLLLMGLRTLARFAARLDHAIAAPCLSPWQAYGILRELVAELSVFSLNISVLGENREDEKLAPDYAHTRLGTCFAAIHDLIVQLLEGISAGPRFATRFEFKDPYWIAEIPPQILTEIKASGGDCWLVLHSKTMPADVMRESAARMLKVSAPGGMESLLVRALPGIPLALSEYAPQGMPRMQGALYFRIEREDPHWEGVEKTGCIGLHWTEAPDDLDAQLAVLSR
jgi:type VI secretion system protein ImpJ